VPEAVVHVCDKFGVRGSSIHGVSRLFAWWFPRYDASRWRVSLVGLKRPEPASRLLEAQGIPVHHLSRGPFDPRILVDLVRLVRSRRARILHVHGYAAADFGRLAARLTGAALVLHEHFADPRMPRYQALADRLLAGLTDRAIAVSASTRDFLVRERRVPAERVRLIWNGAPLQEFAPRPPEVGRELRRALGVPAAAPLIGTVSRLSLQKGHRHLLDALPAVLAARPEARLLVVGDGDQAGALRDQAESLGVAQAVHFAGHRDDVPEVLAALDVLCLPSLYEGTPLALFEAMAARRAIVASAVDGCRELLEDGVTGLLVPARDAQALARALLRVLGDDALRASLAEAAHRASSRYDVGDCVRRMEALYEELLAERGTAWR
jgi:glycosyltransferase involved in cell wall biosynthesis